MPPLHLQPLHCVYVSQPIRWVTSHHHTCTCLLRRHPGLNVDNPMTRTSGTIISCNCIVMTLVRLISYRLRFVLGDARIGLGGAPPTRAGCLLRVSPPLVLRKGGDTRRASTRRFPGTANRQNEPTSLIVPRGAVRSSSVSAVLFQAPLAVFDKTTARVHNGGDALTRRRAPRPGGDWIERRCRPEEKAGQGKGGLDTGL